MLETLDPSLPRKRSYFRMPAIFVVLAVLCVIFGANAGFGPCGGPGLFFLLPFLAFALAAVLTFAVACGKLIARRHAHR